MNDAFVVIHKNVGQKNVKNAFLVKNKKRLKSFYFCGSQWLYSQFLTTICGHFRQLSL